MSIYMKVQGIDGNVTAQGLQNYIQLESFGFGIIRKMNTQPGVINDREGSRPTVHEVVVTKRVDKTTPRLFQEATTGLAIPEVAISFRNTGKDLTEYLNVRLHNVLISGYELDDEMPKTERTEGTTVKKRPVEKLSLNFDKIEVKYTPYDAQHNPGSPIPAGYDLKTAQAS